MDELDTAIVRFLQSDARMTNRDLAQRLDIAPSTSLERMRSLRERGVIRGFHAEVDLAAIGRNVEAMIAVSLRPQAREIIESFRDFVLEQPETVAVYVVTGEQDVLVHVAVESPRHLQDFVLDRLTRRKEISGLNTSVVYDHRKNHDIAPVAKTRATRTRTK